MGRPTSLTDLVAQQIVAAIKNGATREAAAQSAGRSKSALQDWLARGEQGEEPYASFAARVQEAQGKVLAEVHGIVLTMARDSELQPAVRLNACLNILKRETPTVVTKADAAETRDPVADLDVVRATLRALESRAKVA